MSRWGEDELAAAGEDGAEDGLDPCAVERLGDVGVAALVGHHLLTPPDPRACELFEDLLEGDVALLQRCLYLFL